MDDNNQYLDYDDSDNNLPDCDKDNDHENYDIELIAQKIWLKMKFFIFIYSNVMEVEGGVAVTTQCFFRVIMYTTLIRSKNFKTKYIFL